MMSPRDKIHIIELLVTQEGFFIQLNVFFQCDIMFKNQNEKQQQLNQLIYVRVTMIYKKRSPRDNTLYVLVLDPITDIPDYQLL